jgi:predicted ATPase
MHQQVARLLTARFPQTAEAQPELVAHHYTEAADPEPAIYHWQRAGQKAAERSANVEAIAHLTQGLDLLKAVPDTAECAQLELTLQSALGTVLAWTKGNAAPEVEAVYNRALELSQKVGETPELFPMLRSLWNFYLLSGSLSKARELGPQLLSLGERLQDPVLLSEAHRTVGVSCLWRGEFTSALSHLEESIALYDPQQRRPIVMLSGGDTGVNSRFFFCACVVVSGISGTSFAAGG